jgi:hypothetical protein
MWLKWYEALGSIPSTTKKKEKKKEEEEEEEGPRDPTENTNEKQKD